MAADRNKHVEPSANEAGCEYQQSGLQRRRLALLDAEPGTVSGHGQKVLSWGVILKLAFQSIGVVYGDVGTSPLYVYSSTFPDGIKRTDDLLGVLSLIIYTLTLITFIKYVLIVLWANDNGDGGTFALYSLICRYAKVSLIPNQQAEDRELSAYKLPVPGKQLRRSLKIKECLEGSMLAKNILLIVTLLGTSMVIGDGVLTPCISVLSATSGIKAKAHFNQDAVVAISVVILILLFSVQKFGTDKVGYTFAPAILIWFIFIGLIGIYNFFKYDASVIRALNPKQIYDYLHRNGEKGRISLGGVVLCITGTEAMFADLGHFSVRSIQIGFASIVYPSLICAYTGQAAYLMKYYDNVLDTFYSSIPHPLYWPMFVVAVVASIIASQAMISGAFSIVAQSLSLGCFPRVKVVHTSSKYEGQVYIPEINYTLMIACVIVTAVFRDTTKIGNAYGVAVVAVMIITTFFLSLTMLMIWQTNIFLVGAFVAVFGSVEIFYFSAVLMKIKEGGYLPIAFAGVLLFIMYVWHYVQRKRYFYEMDHKVSAEYMKGLGSNAQISRVPGIGLLYSELVHGIPPIFSHFVSNFAAVHSLLIFVSIKFVPVSRVQPDERFIFRRVEPKAYRMYRCVARYGYSEVRIGREEFENHLLESLKEFIRTDYLSVSNSFAQLPQLQITGRDEIEIPCNNLLNSAPASDANVDSPWTLPNSGEQTVNDGPLRGLEQELSLLEEAKNSGVAYLLGESEVTAGKDSSFPKRFVVNYAYNFLRRNFRQGTETLEIPHESLLKVGMNYEI